MKETLIFHAEIVNILVHFLNYSMHEKYTIKLINKSPNSIFQKLQMYLLSTSILIYSTTS